MVSMAESLESVSSPPCTTLHPCVPCQPTSPCDQSALYRTIPAGSGVDGGEGCPTVGVAAFGGTLVDDVPAAQPPSEKSRNPIRKIRTDDPCFKRKGSAWESAVRMITLCKP